MIASSDTIGGLVQRQRVVPILRAPTFADPVGLARALLEAGFSVMEFTLTADNALDAIAEAKEVEGVVVGCGTVTTAAEARSARDAGASFLVAPGLMREVAKATDLPTMLAGLTPTELHEATRLTGGLVKLFPASAVGPGYVRSVLAVFPHLRIVATGGIVPDNAWSFIDAGVLAVGSGYPGPVDGHLDPSAVAEGARSLRHSIDNNGERYGD